MTAHDSKNTLDRLWEGVPVGTPPLEDLVRGGRAMRRRARLRAGGGAAALTLAVVAGSTVAANTVFDGTSPRPGDGAPTLADAPTAPVGQRLVGAGRAVVAVPAGWNAYGLRGCEPSAKSTIWFELESSGADLDCPSVAHKSPTVKISTLDSDGGKAAKKFATRPRVVDGVEVFRELVACPDDAFCIGDTAVRLVVVPTENVAFTISGPIRAHETLDAIADSVQILPENYTTVPFVEGNYPLAWNAAIAEAGLLPDGRLPTCGQGDVCVSHPRVLPDPAPGTVVAVGSTVTLFPTTVPGESVDLPTSEWEPGDPSQLALYGGIVSIGEQGCVVLTAPGAGIEGYGSENEPPTYAVWPKDYTATIVDGELHILGPDGDLVARQGDLISVGGGFGSASSFPHPCLPDGDHEIFVIQSPVTVQG